MARSAGQGQSWCGTLHRRRRPAAGHLSPSRAATRRSRRPARTAPRHG